MANGHSLSRSPVRAIDTVHPSWGNAAPAHRAWSEPLAAELPAAAPVSYPVAGNHALSCPECGSVLRLSLTVWRNEMLPPRPREMSPLTLQPAPEQEESLDFEGSIRRHKRDLIAAALEQNGGVMTRAATALGLKYTTFVAMVHRLGVLETNEETAAE